MIEMIINRIILDDRNDRNNYKSYNIGLLFKMSLNL